jgi:hypothetical protein
MKTIISRAALLTAAVFTFAFAQAADPVRMNGAARNTTALERNLDRALNRHLSFPLANKADMTGEVYVSFVIDKEGRVEVLDCRADNQQLKDYVLRKLARIDIGENPEGIWKTTHMRITFRPEQRGS